MVVLIEGVDCEGNDVYGEVRTDSRGRCTFFGLPTGTFSVLEVQPSGYADWVDGIGSSGGTFGGPSAPSRRNIAVLTTSGSDLTGYVFRLLPGTLPPTL